MTILTAFRTGCAILTVVLFTLPPLLAHFGLFPKLPAFMLWVASIIPATLAVLVALALGIKGPWSANIAPLLLGLLPLVILIGGLVQSRQYPPINDITTNLDSPPPFETAGDAAENRGKDLSYPDHFKVVVRAAYPDLISLRLPYPAEQAFALVVQTAQAQDGWHIARVDQDALTLEGSATEGLFKFTDDFVIRVSPMDGEAQIDMRSRSRLGRADFGANARRIRRFFESVTASAAIPPA